MPLPEIDIDALAIRLEARRYMTAKQRQADNKKFKEAAAAMPHVNRGKTVKCLRLDCREPDCAYTCESEVDWDRHSLETGHRTAQLALDLLRGPSDAS